MSESKIFENIVQQEYLAIELDKAETDLCLLNLADAEADGEISHEDAAEYRAVLLEHKESK